MFMIAAERLEELTVALLRALGANDLESNLVGRHLVEANLVGADSHGVIRIPQYAEAIRRGRVVLGAEARIVRETHSSALIDGNHGFGQVVGHRAMSLAVEKAGVNAVGAVAAFNCGHTGRLASYTQMAADRQMIGIMMVNAGGAGQRVAPFGGIERRLATNPISFAAPTGTDRHIVLDMATSVAPEGKARELLSRGDQVPPGWMIDARGNATQDPEDLYGPGGGALLPLGGPVGHKGFGLAVMVDLLAGGLSTAGCVRADAPPEPSSDGVLAMAIDISHFTPVGEFHRRVGAVIRHIKSSIPAEGFEEVLIPGEPEDRIKAKRLRSGIPVDEGAWHQIEMIAQELGIRLGPGGTMAQKTR
jgi:LDH2 family malate/lactate/ureidoglycolate dehydrogenase